MKSKFKSIYFIIIFASAFACKNDLQKKEAIQNNAEADTIATKTKTPSQVIEDDKTYSVVQQMPLFSGHTNYDSSRVAIQQFITKNLKYPKLAKDSGVEGVVLINFIVNKDSTLSDFKIMKDIGAQCGEEAIRVVQSMNEQGIKWTPGKHQGKIVKVKYHLPVRFKLY